MKSIILSAGHSNKIGRDRGAAGSGFVEGNLTVELRQLISDDLKKLGLNPIMDGNNTILAESLNFFKKLISANAIALEIHFNSGPDTATGVETLVPENPSLNERIIASGLSQIVRDAMNIPMRGNNGVKTELESHHGKLGWMRLNCENLLLEVCFISNPKEMEIYQKNKFIIGQRIAKYLYNVAAGNSLIADSLQKYLVKSGDTLTLIAKNHNTTVDNLKKINHLQGDFITVGQELIVNN